MSDFPQFSVVVPLYNKRAYIRRAVDSVLAQTLTDFELIVVDDGSTDGSSEALAEIDDIRLRIIRQQNQGEGAARNTGLRVGRGNWIALLDADDEWMGCHLRELAEVAATFPDAGLISTKCMVAAGDKMPLLPTPKIRPSIHMVDYFLEASRQIGFINSTSSAINREVFEKLGGFISAKAGADLEYWARAALTFPVAVSERVTCAYFRDTGGVMSQISKDATNRRQMPISGLRELSPSVATLCAHAEENQLLWNNPSIRAYVNSRLEAAIRAALHYGDLINAKNYTKFFISPVTINQWLYRISMRGPLWIVGQGVNGIRWAKELSKQRSIASKAKV